MLVVANSSPLIYLSRVGVLHVLPALFGDVVVPRAVWDEVVERRPESNVLPAPEPVLEALVAEGFRIAPALVRQALAHVGEGPEGVDS